MCCSVSETDPGLHPSRYSRREQDPPLLDSNPFSEKKLHLKRFVRDLEWNT